MSFQFAICNRKSALDFIQKMYPNKKITDTLNSAGILLDFVEKDIVRIQDPMMHGNMIQVIPGKKWDESLKDDVVKACEIFHKMEKEELLKLSKIVYLFLFLIRR